MEVVGESIKLSSGEGKITLSSTNTTLDEQGVVIVVPTMFAIGIPVFDNGVPYQILARLRYRAKPRLTFWYELWRTNRVFDHAFNEAVEQVQNETQRTVWLGSPE